MAAVRETRLNPVQLQVSSDDLLSFVNRLDRVWHDQPRDYEREALTRLFSLLTLPARLLSARRPAALGRDCLSARNIRLTGTAVRDIFFRDQPYTEVDCVLIQAGSGLGHLGAGASYVIEVERKRVERGGDYYRAMQRTRKVAELFRNAFRSDFYPVLVFDDRDGGASYPQFDQDLVAIAMKRLQELTYGLRISHPDEIPGRSSDRTLVKLDMLWLIAQQNPDAPGFAPISARAVLELARRHRVRLHLPIAGHQDVDRMDTELRRWLAQAEEDDKHLLEERLPKYLSELETAGALVRDRGGYLLTREGGTHVLEYTRFLDERAQG